jgi:hypothetical protein
VQLPGSVSARSDSKLGREDLVFVGWAARWLKTDRRQLTKLCKTGVVPGELVDGAIALDCRELAAWA